MVENSEDSRAREQVMSYTTASFRLKMRIEKGGGNRVGVTVSSLRQLGFSKEKMKFRGGEVVFHKLKIRCKTTNVAEIDVENVRGGIKTLGVAIRRAVYPGDFLWSPPQLGTPRQCIL